MRQASSTAVYFRVAAALYLLLGLTILCAFVNLGPLNFPIAMLIAALKTLLVALFFMHVRSARGIVRVAACAGALWLIVLIVLTLTDFLTRT